MYSQERSQKAKLFCRVIGSTSSRRIGIAGFRFGRRRGKQPLPCRFTEGTDLRNSFKRPSLYFLGTV